MSLPTPTLLPPTLPREPLASRLSSRAKLYSALALLLFPTIAATLLFTYYPQYSAFKYSLYKWDGQATEEFRWFKNFENAWDDSTFWASFQLTFVLLLANLIKMWPSIFTAVVLHRIRSERAQYIYRVLFVIPMIMPGVVGLLIWKSFYDPHGALNSFLNLTGLIHALRHADHALPALTNALLPARHTLIDRPFGSVWGLALLGAIFTLALTRFKSLAPRLVWSASLLAAGYLIWITMMGQPLQFILWNVVGFGAPLAIQFALGRPTLERVAKPAAFLCFAAAAASVLLTMIWTRETHAFSTPYPNWLGHSQLIVPAMIFWGFPWVGTIGVLIYLAGLQTISTDVYEAADLDGVSSLGKLFRIELPLILTQVRINLIFMTIGTLTDYGLILLLLGPSGGPGQVGMVPGLYAYNKAFVENEYGYACALGIVMFAIILAITIVYQKLVKIDK